MTRREFVRRENVELGRFLDGEEGLLAGWHRSYRCDCGFRCNAPGDIYDHAQTCGQQLDLLLPPAAGRR
jgi:hypothetical protein